RPEDADFRIVFNIEIRKPTARFQIQSGIAQKMFVYSPNIGFGVGFLVAIADFSLVRPAEGNRGLGGREMVRFIEFFDFAIAYNGIYLLDFPTSLCSQGILIALDIEGI